MPEKTHRRRGFLRWNPGLGPGCRGAGGGLLGGGFLWPTCPYPAGGKDIKDFSNIGGCAIFHAHRALGSGCRIKFDVLAFAVIVHEALETAFDLWLYRRLC